MRCNGSVGGVQLCARRIGAGTTAAPAHQGSEFEGLFDKPDESTPRDANQSAPDEKASLRVLLGITKSAPEVYTSESGVLVHHGSPCELPIHGDLRTRTRYCQIGTRLGKRDCR
ncbi:hypothetical protein GCM10023339_41380 [Alloalcanivorax gelatiniphagus]